MDRDGDGDGEARKQQEKEDIVYLPPLSYISSSCGREDTYIYIRTLRQELKPADKQDDTLRRSTNS